MSSRPKRAGDIKHRFNFGQPYKEFEIVFQLKYKIFDWNKGHMVGLGSILCLIWAYFVSVLTLYDFTDTDHESESEF